MMKKYKKIITTILICVSLLCLIPLQAKIIFLCNDPSKGTSQQAHQESIECPLHDVVLHIENKDFERFLCAIVDAAVMSGQRGLVSEALMQCYEQVMHDAKLVRLHDLQTALPELFDIIESYCQEHAFDLKAPRPSHHDLVGPGNCNVSTVLNVLRQILAALDACCTTGSNDFNVTLTVIEADFNSTFSLLNTLEQSLQGTFTILADSSDTLTACCAAIVADFNGTFSVIAAGFDGTFSTINLVSNQPTITAVADLFTTATTCCATLQEDFQETWTILDGINPTTSIVSSFLREFQFTWSILEAGFDGTFSALDECCDTVNSEFQQTWSIIEAGFDGTFTSIKAISEPQGTFSALAALQDTIINDFNGTWSLVEAGFESTFSIIDSRADVSCVGTFTAIAAGFQGTYSALDACCNTITNEFQQTWSILDTGFDNTFSTLVAIRDNIATTTLSIDFSGVYTVLASGFNGTFSSLADVNNTMTDFNGTFSILNTIFRCTATTVTAGGTITDPGYYCLNNDINGSFTITANDVVLDLNNHTISNGGVFVLTGTYRTIKNGRLDNSNAGISLTNNTNTVLSDLTITNATLTPAITFTGINVDNKVNRVVIENCAIGLSSTNDNNLLIDTLTIQRATTVGMTFTASNNLRVYNVSIFNTGSNGIDLTNPANVNFSDIAINNAVNQGLICYGSSNRSVFENIRVINGMLVYGIKLNLSTGCTLRNCLVSGITSPVGSVTGIQIGEDTGQTGASNRVDACSVKNITVPGSLAGILLSSQNSTIRNCNVQSLTSTNNGVNGIVIAGNNSAGFNCNVFNINSTDPAGVSGSNAYSIPARDIQLFNSLASTVSIAIAGGNNGAVGFYLNNDAINCYDCVATNVSSSGLSAFGFYGEIGAIDYFIKNCSVNNCTGIGFVVNGVGVLYESQASNIFNSNNSVITNGFLVGNPATAGVSIINCTAINAGNRFKNKDGRGFMLPASSNHPVYHCLSFANGDNITSFNDNYVNAPNVQRADGGTFADPVVAGSNVSLEAAR